MSDNDLQLQLAEAKRALAELEAEQRRNPREQEVAIEAADAHQLMYLRARLDVLPPLIRKARRRVQEAEFAIVEAKIPPVAARVAEREAKLKPAEAELKQAQEHLDQVWREFRQASAELESLHNQRNQVFQA